MSRKGKKFIRVPRLDDDVPIVDDNEGVTQERDDIPTDNPDEGVVQEEIQEVYD